MNLFKILKFRYFVHEQLFITKFVELYAIIHFHFNRCFFNYCRLQ